MLNSLSQPQPPKYVLGEQINPAPRMVVVIMLLLLMLGISVYFIKKFPVSDAILPLAQQTVTLPSGQSVQLLLFANSRVNNHLLQATANTVSAALLQCHQSPWQQVYLSISHEKQILNISLKGERNGHLVLRNIKAGDSGRQVGFINQQWLQGVHLCD
ncbi:hypothetical protein [Shewanella dokdonensis]|uniref:Uncharacterized protein n=1 Tax=Shewanella dokdonensis TaxID=712036 RepID=A0ABX8DDZ7_9GAMM|nr:hypothetical protein [Shewanella dokdonensis]MCL1074539.1 hypothetical protein [Shewanella dokdonensis]QVK22431.1 hypothetical protein KHX94_13795 [Shewanella dokdonensis]